MRPIAASNLFCALRFTKKCHRGSWLSLRSLLCISLSRVNIRWSLGQRRSILPIIKPSKSTLRPIIAGIACAPVCIFVIDIIFYNGNNVKRVLFCLCSLYGCFGTDQLSRMFLFICFIMLGSNQQTIIQNCYPYYYPPTHSGCAIPAAGM